MDKATDRFNDLSTYQRGLLFPQENLTSVTSHVHMNLNCMIMILSQHIKCVGLPPTRVSSFPHPVKGQSDTRITSSWGLSDSAPSQQYTQGGKSCLQQVMEIYLREWMMPPHQDIQLQHFQG